MFRKAAALVPMSIRRRVRFYRAFDRLPSLKNPLTFNEKILWRMLYDRRDVMVDTCDKARMKHHALRTAGDTVQIPALRWQGTNLEDLKQVRLPEHWVLKPNHRSSFVIFGTGEPDVPTLQRSTEGWLDRNEWTESGEWAYSKADATFIVEDRIGYPDEDLVDYKFYVFDGEVKLVQAHTNRFTNHGIRTYSTDWQPFALSTLCGGGPEVPRPEMLDQMMDVASRIAAGFDFMRVDLYAHEGKIWFGELTPYPGSGLVGWEPEVLDLEIGSWWKLPDVTTSRLTQ